MIEALLLHLLVGLIVFGCVYAVLRLVMPNLGAPEWAVQVAYIIVGCMFIIWLVYLLLPLVHSPPL